MGAGDGFQAGVESLQEALRGHGILGGQAADAADHGEQVLDAMVEFAGDDLVALLRLVFDGDVDGVLDHVGDGAVFVAKGTVRTAPDDLAHAAVFVGNRKRLALEHVLFAGQRSPEGVPEDRLPLRPLRESVEDIRADQVVAFPPGYLEVARVHLDEPKVRIQHHEGAGQGLEKRAEIHTSTG